MNKLWRYEDYVNHLSHENGMVRRWAFDALETRYLNRYTEQAADLINDEETYFVCAVLRYLSFHQANQHAPAILERFKRAQGVIAGNCASALAKLQYEPAMEVMLQRFSTTEDPETFLGILEYLGNIPDEKCRTALREAVGQMQDTMVLRSATANLLHHFNTEDLNLVMERFFTAGGSYDRFDTPLKHILSPLGGGAYFGDFTEFGHNEILSNPSETVDSFVLRNSHITIDETLRENLITLLETRRYQDFSTAIMFDARNMVHARYPQKDIPDDLKGLSGQDTMCLHLLELLSKHGMIWKQAVSSNDFASDLIAFILSAYFAIEERSAYARALSPEAGVEELIQALQGSGPNLPVQIQNKIKVLSPITEVKRSLSNDLSTWGDIWTVKLMGMIGSKEFVPDLIRVLRNADGLDYIYDDALKAMTALDESADESILTSLKNGELDDWASFAILEHLPYPESYELAVNLWENPSEKGMDSYELFSRCLRGIGDRQGIQKLQDVYANENDAGYIGDSLECLSKIHGVDIPELPDIIKKRKKKAEKLKARMNQLNDPVNNPAKNHPAIKEQGMMESAANVVPFKRESRKIGRNEPCPCGSGKKYKNVV
jgi:hypothetical protein